MIQLTKQGTAFSGSAEDLRRLREQFDHNHYVRIPQIVEAGLLQFIQARLEQAEYRPMSHGQYGEELCAQDEVLLHLLHFLTNTAALFQMVETITGCGEIGCFTGRVYRMVSGRGHYDSWHNDMVENRMVAMTINLGRDSYSGGVLQLRERRSKQVIQEIANTGRGDAIIFRLAEQLQHKITGVTSGAAKTAFAGWFRSESNYLQELKKNRPPASAG